MYKLSPAEITTLFSSLPTCPLILSLKGECSPPARAIFEIVAACLLGFFTVNQLVVEPIVVKTVSKVMVSVEN